MTLASLNDDSLLRLKPQLLTEEPLSLLPKDSAAEWLQSGKLISCSPGQRLIRPDQLNSFVFLVLQGEVRLIAMDPVEGQITLKKVGPGQLLGWVSLLRGEPSEFVQASSEVRALALSSVGFVERIRLVPAFANYFQSLSNPLEAYGVAVSALDQQVRKTAGWREGLLKTALRAQVISLKAGQSFDDLPELPEEKCWYLSTGGLPGFPVGTPLIKGSSPLPEKPGFTLLLRCVALDLRSLDIPKTIVKSADLPWADVSSLNDNLVDLQQLGILEDDILSDQCSKIKQARLKDLKSDLNVSKIAFGDNSIVEF